MDTNNPFVDQHLAYLLPIFLIAGLVFVALILFPLWRICGKAGFSPWLSMLVFLPLGPLILLYVLAFVHWRVVPAPMLGTGYPPYPPPPAYPAPTLPPAQPGQPYRPG